ncbi:MAG TPA: hypothetical protein VHD61_08915 [Lacunisphaera sp.]|nr:hypothetical protein [Lacunisphaera sp.]
MTGAIRSALTSRRGLLAVLALGVAVEAAPLLLVWLAGGIWPLNNGEDFDLSFWPPLKTAYPPCFYCFHVGYYFLGVLHAVHQLTAWTTGSRLVDLEYFQHFGYLTRLVYGGATVGAAAWFLRARRDRGSLFLAGALLLGVPLAAPNILAIYHLRVGSQLSYKLLTLVIAFASLSALEDYLQGRRPARGRVLHWGLLAGVTVIEIPHYILFLLPAFFLGAGSLRGFLEFLAYTGRWALGGIAGGLLGLLVFFGTDTDSLVAAVYSIARGYAVGFAQPQPGFEQFTRMVFDPRSDYFLVHIILAVHACILAGFGGFVAVRWSRLTSRFRFAGLALLAAWLLVAAAHVHIWKTRGSYTTVFSLVYGDFVLCALVIRHLLLARGLPGVLPPRMFRAAIAAAALAFVVPCGLTLGWSNLAGLYRNQVVHGAAFRSFNGALAGLPKPVGVAFSPDLTPYFLGSHYIPAGYLTHIGLGWHGEDGRYSGRIRADRFPDFVILHGVRLRSATLNLRESALDILVEEGWPSPPAATIVAVPMDAGIAAAPAVEKAARLVRYAGSPDQADLAGFLLAAPDRGLESRGSGLRWFIAPLPPGGIGESLLDRCWPAAWPRTDRRFFFLSAPSGFLLLSLAELPSHP